MEEIIFKSSIKTVAIKDEDGNTLSVLNIDSADSTILERFSDMLIHLENYEKEAIEESNEIDRTYEKDSVDMIVAHAKSGTKYINKICDEIDMMFGAGTIHNLFRLNYEINPSFVPDEILILDFLDGIIPIMEKIYGARIESKRKRFNVNRTGGKRE